MRHPYLTERNVTSPLASGSDAALPGHLQLQLHSKHHRSFDVVPCTCLSPPETSTKISRDLGWRARGLQGQNGETPEQGPPLLFHDRPKGDRSPSRALAGLLLVLVAGRCPALFAGRGCALGDGRTLRSTETLRPSILPSLLI